ncbi:MAG TPA: shikimate kinase [Desulfurella acetivorans]|uniref:Shikimate kinase n=1 Tax=Desulfurella acetivorans TaxID=33002 RepID=A0A7C6A717_DESAE|nr:shikimate kinase [Desulfurella acetivorans]
MNLILIGFMGSGKTSIGKLISKQFNYEFIDTDALIEKKMKMPIKKIFRTFGEYFFRKLERYVLINTNPKKPFVLATGGGMPCFKNNIDIMKKKGTIIYLKIPKKRLFKTDNKNRPLFNDKAQILLNKRKNCYAKADFTIENDKIETTLKIIKTIMR